MRQAIFALTLAAAVLLSGCAKRQPAPPVIRAKTAAVTGPVCDDSLWDHVYTGDPAKFSSPKDRLKVLRPCITVTGKIDSAVAEKDGDFHIRLAVDSQFAELLNEKNQSGQSGHLVVEPVCQNKVTQADTLKEKVCIGFKQEVYKSSMKNKHVAVTGVYVEDMEHGWREIHPVTSIRLVP